MNHCIDLFEQTARKFPEKMAVRCGERAYTFAELQKRAKQIAKRIDDSFNDLGGAEDQEVSPAAVIVSRNTDPAVYFLAVLYSRRFYVPIDPEMPPAKQQSVLLDCSPQVLLCSGSQNKLVSDLGFSGAVITMEDVPEDAEELDISAVSYMPEDPVYMVYTSGSTGKPKGVLKSHAAVVSFITAFIREFALDENTVIGNQTPFFFDASAKDYYLMMAAGASMEIIPSELFMYPPKLIDYLNERRVNYICWVPTALAMVTQINTFKQVRPLYLKKVLFVGEVFPLKQLRRWMEALPELEYANLYGSTELAGISCFCRLDTSAVPDYIPVGKPLGNCSVFLYDNEEKRLIGPQEKDKIGEICVVSDALAMEYYHDPQKTAEIFVQMDAGLIPSASGGIKTVRVLKTGDLARYDDMENLVFSSRKDFQIKLMGRRIELGEIEAAADKVAEIQRNCCIFDDVKRKIIMYCELTEGCSWSGREVREALKERLSDYMVPSSVKVMEKLPLNANGKIDRKRLKSL